MHVHLKGTIFPDILYRLVPKRPPFEFSCVCNAACDPHWCDRHCSVMVRIGVFIVLLVGVGEDGIIS